MGVSDCFVLVDLNRDMMMRTWGHSRVASVARNVLILIGLVYAVCVAAQYICLRFLYPLDKNKTLELEKKLGRSNVELIGETGDEE